MMLLQHRIYDLIQFRIINVMYVWKQMMRHMIIESSENKVGCGAERVKIIGTSYLVIEP